jgi:hypothetical protein
VTYFSSRQDKHEHGYFADADDPTRPLVCLCGKEKGKRLAKTGTNKFNARKTVHGEFTYDSGKEAKYAAELDLLVKAGKILRYDRQYPVSVDPEGQHLFTTKVDFRLHMPDGSYELHEVKSWITARDRTYRLKLKALELFWLPKHPEYTYHVIE